MSKRQSNIYESENTPRKRRENYYPSEALKKELNEYSLNTGMYKSELAVLLLKSFFAARRKEGRDPKVITIVY